MNDLEGSSYTDDSPGVDYQVAALVNGGEASRSGVAVFTKNCHSGTTWRPGEKCRIAPTSFAFEIKDDGTACVGSLCSTGNSLGIWFQTGHFLIRVGAERSPDGTWTLHQLTPQGPSNRAPIALGLIEPVVLAAEDESETVDVRLFFEDPDGDELMYSALSSNGGVATVRIAGGSLTITPGHEGQATVTVTARDPDGLSATQSVVVTVESADFFRWAEGWRLKLLSDHAATPEEDADDTSETGGSDAGN